MDSSKTEMVNGNEKGIVSEVQNPVEVAEPKGEKFDVNNNQVIESNKTTGSSEHDSLVLAEQKKVETVATKKRKTTKTTKEERAWARQTNRLIKESLERYRNRKTIVRAPLLCTLAEESDLQLIEPTKEELAWARQTIILVEKSLKRYKNRKRIVRAPQLFTLAEHSDFELIEPTEEELAWARQAILLVEKSLKRYKNRKRIVRAPPLFPLAEVSEDEEPFSWMTEKAREERAWTMRTHYLQQQAKENYRNRKRVVKATLLVPLGEETELEEEVEQPAKHELHSIVAEEQEVSDGNQLEEAFEALKL